MDIFTTLQTTLKPRQVTCDYRCVLVCLVIFLSLLLETISISAQIIVRKTMLDDLFNDLAEGPMPDGGPLSRRVQASSAS